MRANNRSAKPRKQWRLLRRAAQMQRAQWRDEWRREKAEGKAEGLTPAQMFKRVYDKPAFSTPVEFSVVPDPFPGQWQRGPEPGALLPEPIVMTPPPGGWAQDQRDDEKPEWPYRWKPKAWLEKRGFKRLLPEPWP